MDSRGRARRRGKDFERLVATLFTDGHRILLKGHEVADVEGSKVIVECKYRDKIAGYILGAVKHVRSCRGDKVPLTFLKQRGGAILVVISLDDFRQYFGEIVEMI